MDENNKLESQKKKSDFLLIAGIVLAVLFLLMYFKNNKLNQTNDLGNTEKETTALIHGDNMQKSESIELPISWNNLGAKLAEAGVLDRNRLIELYNQSGGLMKSDEQLIDGTNEDKILVTKENANLLLNLFWALGLSNKNPILENGPMMSPNYNVGQLASTGGWTLAKGNAIDHYSKHDFIKLTQEQQALVEKVSKNIYRPCCDNSTYFPDCNHGMAMLGLLELLASQGASETQIYNTALLMNTFWFPQQYQTISRYLKMKGVKLENTNSKEVLGINYSSASGYQQISNLLPQEQKNGTTCGLSTLIPQTKNEQTATC